MNSPTESIRLPKKKRELALVIHRHAQREMARAMPMYTIWKLATAYLQGHREFSVFRPYTGKIRSYVVDDKGKLGFQFQKLLTDINEVADKIGEMDIRPSIGRPDSSLSSIRDRAMLQIIADAITDEDSLNAAKEHLTFTLSCYGGCGLTGDVHDSPSIGLTASHSVIHPRELFPFPSLGDDYTNEQGIMRQRLVPLHVLVDKFGKSLLSEENLMKMERWEIPIGDTYTDPFDVMADNEGNISGLYDPGDVSMGNTTSGRPPGRNSDMMDLVRIRELWLHGPRSTCKRFVVTSGELVLEDMDYTNDERPRAIAYTRFLNNGSWHGAGLFHVLFSIHLEMEKLLRDLFTNIRSVDKYGVVVLPSGQYNERNLLKDAGNGLRLLNFTPEANYGGESFRPFAIQPHSSGEIPGKTALLAGSLMQQLNPITDLVANKGRIDGAPGLQMLEEEGRRKLNRVFGGVARAFGTIHKFNTGLAVHESIATSAMFPVGRMNLEMAGATIDFEKETVSFNENTIPKIHRATFTVRDVVPQNREARKQQAINLATTTFAVGGMPDADGLKLHLLDKGYEIEAWVEEERTAFEVVNRNILKLYGNGEQGQRILVSEHCVKPALQLRVLQAFMGGVVFERASVRVKNDFIDYKQQLQNYIAGVLPSPMMNPDDYAEQQALRLTEQGVNPVSGGPLPMNLKLPQPQGA